MNNKCPRCGSFLETSSRTSGGLVSCATCKYRGDFGFKEPSGTPSDDSLFDLAISGSSAILGSALETVKWTTLGTAKVVRRGIVGQRKLAFLAVPPSMRRRFRDTLSRSPQKVEMSDNALIFQAVASGDIRDALNALESVWRPQTQETSSSQENLTAVLRSRFAPYCRVLSFEQPTLTFGQAYDVRVVKWTKRDTHGGAVYFALGYLNGLAVELYKAEQREGWSHPSSAPFSLGDYVRCTPFMQKPNAVQAVFGESIPPADVRIHPPQHRLAYILASSALYLEAHLTEIPAFGAVASVDYIANPQDLSRSPNRLIRFDLALRSSTRLSAARIACLSANRMHAMVSDCPEDYPPLVEIARNSESDRGRFVSRAAHTFAMSVGRFRRNTQQCMRLQEQCFRDTRTISGNTIARFVHVDDECAKDDATWLTLSDQRVLIKQAVGPGVYHLLFSDNATPDRSGKSLARAIAVSPSSFQECIRIVNGTTELFHAAHKIADITRTKGKKLTTDHALRQKSVGRFLGSLRNRLHLSRQIQLRQMPLATFTITRAKEDPRRRFVTLSLDPSPSDVLDAGASVFLLAEDQTQIGRRATVSRVGRSSVSIAGDGELIRDAKYVCTDVDDAPYRIQAQAIERISLDSSRTNYARRILSSIQSRHNFSWRSARRLTLFNNQISSNPAMVTAIRSALRPNRNILAVQGPPGTGKTTFIVELVRQLVETQGAKVLVTSQSNLAVDEVLARLIRTSSTCTAIRIGATEKLLDEVKPLHFALDDADAWERLRSRVRGTQAALAWSGQFLQRLASVARDIVSARSLQQATGSPFAAALQWVDVVGATCVGIGTDRAMPFSQATYDVVIIDEASRATTAETLIPMRLGRRCVIVGDHKQLPPTIDQSIRRELTRLGEPVDTLDASLFEQLQLGGDKEHVSLRLPERKRILLNTQFRMHPEIASFVSDVFYAPDQEALVSHESTYSRGFSAGVFSGAISVINTQRYPRTECEKIHRVPINQEKKVGTSRQNELEAWLVVRVLRVLRDELRASKSVAHLSVGIITPYAAQVFLLRHKLRSLSSWSPLAFEDDSVSTVDAFQGKEKDIIILTFVRSISSERVSLAFLKDLRRINVACSRARHKLIMIGDGETLRKADRGILHEHNRKVYDRLLASFKQGGVAQHVWWQPEDCLRVDGEPSRRD